MCERDHLKDLGVDGRITVVQEVRLEGVDWIDLTSDTDGWLTVLHSVMNTGFHKMQRISWLPKDLLASQEGLCSMELGPLQFKRSD